jgi:hypothetical protein
MATGNGCAKPCFSSATASKREGEGLPKYVNSSRPLKLMCTINALNFWFTVSEFSFFCSSTMPVFFTGIYKPAEADLA